MQHRFPLVVPLFGDNRPSLLFLLLDLHLLLLVFAVVGALESVGRRWDKDGILDLLRVPQRLVALLLAQLLEPVVQHHLVHVAQFRLGLLDDEFLQQPFPVIDVDHFSRGEFRLHLLLQLDELVVRLAAQQARDLGFDGRVGARLGLVGRGADRALFAEGFERRGRDDQERAPELLVRLDLFEREVHLDVVVQLFGVFEREVLRGRRAMLATHKQG